MSNVCAICGKGSTTGRKYNKLMSKYNPTPKSRRRPNLQWTILPSGERVKVCTRCKRTLAKEK